MSGNNYFYRQRSIFVIYIKNKIENEIICR